MLQSCTCGFEPVTGHMKHMQLALAGLCCDYTGKFSFTETRCGRMAITGSVGTPDDSADSRQPWHVIYEVAPSMQLPFHLFSRLVTDITGICVHDLISSSNFLGIFHCMVWHGILGLLIHPWRSLVTCSLVQSSPCFTTTRAY